MDTISRRNTDAFEQVIKDLTKRIFDQQIRIDQLQSAITSMSERLTALDAMLIMQKVKYTGHGPSEKV